MNEKVSIIAPVYNSEKYLHRCLDSIINQTYRNLEIILVNDGSTDASGEICDEYMNKDNRIIVIHQENKGVSASRNAGLDMATGKYIQFVDSDDYTSIDMTEELVRSIKADHTDLVICAFNRIRTNGEVNKTDIKISGKYCKDDYLVYFYDSLRISYFGYLWNKMYLNALIQAKQIRFDEKVTIFEDLIFNIYYFYQANAISFINKNLYNYCYHNPDSLMSNYRKNYIVCFFESRIVLKNMLIYLNIFEINKGKLYHDIANHIFEIFSNLFHKNNAMSKKQILAEIKTIVENDEVKKNKEYFFCSSHRIRIMGILIKYRLVYLLYIYFYLYTKLRAIKRKSQFLLFPH